MSEKRAFFLPCSKTSSEELVSCDTHTHAHARHTHTHTRTHKRASSSCPVDDMGWLRLVGSFKLYAPYRLFYRALLQKSPTKETIKSVVFLPWPNTSNTSPKKSSILVCTYKSLFDVWALQCVERERTRFLRPCHTQCVAQRCSVLHDVAVCCNMRVAPDKRHHQQPQCHRARASCGLASRH